MIREDRGPSPQEGTMWYTGIDQHRQFCVLTTYGPEGPRVKQAKVPSTACWISDTACSFHWPTFMLTS